jgi:hypothetical protein
LEFPLASTRQISEHFHISHTIIKDIFSRQVGLRRFSPRWVLHQLSKDQKAARVRDSMAVLTILRRLQDNSFE